MSNDHPDQRPPPPHAQALELLNAELAAAGVPEGRLLAWLKKVDAVPAGIFALRSIPTRRLEILLENIDQVLANLSSKR